MAKPSKKISKTFLVFLTISSLIWLLITFSKEYTTVIKYPVNYSNIAQDKLLQEAPIQSVDLTVKATGFRILRAKIGKSTIQLDASKLNRKGKSKFYFFPKNQKNKIQKQLLFGVNIQEIGVDTIYLNLGLLKSKKVGLNPNLDVNYHIGYGLLGNILYEPDSIVISGPELQVEKINGLNLSKLVLTDVKADFNETVAILHPKNQKNIKFGIHKVVVSGKVDKFTEGKLHIPFTVENLPENTNLTTLLEDVEVDFVVALSNFTKVSETSFKIKCDYSFSEKNNLGYLIPKLISKPSFIKSYKIYPTKIDFLIQK